MAVAYRSIASTTYASRTNTTVTKPSGTADNDILIAGIHVESDTAVTPPAGWTQITVVDEAVVDIDLYVYWKRASSEGADYTWSHSAVWSSGVIVAVSGAVTAGDPQDATVGTDNNTGANTTVNIPSITTATNGSLVIAMATEYNTAITATTPTGWDERVDADGCHTWTKTQTTAGATGATTSTFSGSTYKVTAVVALKEATTATVEQEGFRWGVDDGSESAHTWEAAQDTNISIASGQSRLLRTLINATGDYASTAFKLKYQKDGSGGYVTVPIGASSVGTTPLIEAADATQSGNDTASASWALSTPTASTGDLLIFGISWDDSTATTNVTAPAGKNSETLTAINATPATDASTETRSKVWYTVCTGAWTAGTITFTPSASESWTGCTIRVPAGEFDSATPIGGSVTNGAAGTTESNIQNAAFTAGASDGGGKLVVWTSADVDPQTVAANHTQIANTDRGTVSGGFFSRNAAVTNSESVPAATVSTIASDSWSTVAFVVRAPVVNNETYITTSANITAGGEATTARLTAPSGKSTSDFVTGRRWDDENGTDSIDITTDDYSELEWLVALKSGLSNGTYYDYRVYNGDVALNTYTTTPRWTVSTGVSITLDTAALTATGRALTLVPGAVTKTLNTASLVANGINLTVVNVNIVLLNTAAMTAGGQALTVLPGAISKLLNTANLTASGRAVTVLPGAFTLTLDTAVITASGQIIQVGNINIIALDTATITAGGQAITPIPGAVSTALDTAILTINGQAFAVVPGAVSKALATALLSASGQSTAIIPGAISTLLDTALLSITGQSATLVPGAVTTLLDTAQITAGGVAVTIQLTGGGAITIILDTAQLLAGGIVLDVVPGNVSTLLDTAQLLVSGQALTPIPGAVSKALATATLSANGQNLTPVPGDVALLLSTAQLLANGTASIILPGGVIIALDTAALLANGQSLTFAALAVIRAWTLRERDTAWSLDDRDTAWSLQARDIDFSLDDREKDWSLRDRDTSWTIDDR